MRNATKPRLRGRSRSGSLRCARALRTVAARRRETFEGLTVEERNALAVDAWTVGLRALSNAYREARESRLQDIGKSVLEDMDAQLKSTLALQEKQLRDALTQFFDPSSGEVTRRLKDFVDDRGELARFLEKHIGVEDSTLAKTLARQVGREQ